MGEGGSKEQATHASGGKASGGGGGGARPKAGEEKAVRSPTSKSINKSPPPDDDEEDVSHDKSGRGKSQKELNAVDEDEHASRVNYAKSEEYWNKGAKNVKKVEAKGKKAKLHSTLNATLKATESVTDLKRNVKLPSGENQQEWIAVNLIHFYNSLNMIFNTLAEFCTEESCPKMSAGSAYEYLWKDNNKYPKPTRLSAKQYIDLLLNWANDRISDPNFLPVDDSTAFPPNFMNDVKDIFRRLFRVYAHIYYNHYTKIKELGASPHLNTCFKHYVIFAYEFDLIPDSEFAPLKKLIDKFME